MKKNLSLQGTLRKAYFLSFCCLLLGFTSTTFAQQLPECDATVPFFVIDLSSDPDSTYTTPEIVRQGQCCGGASNQNYVSFYVTLHPDVAMIEIGIVPGYADPGGSGNYNIVSGGDLLTPGACGPDIPGGQTACITGSGPHKVTYHKPGKNKVKYYLRQIPKPIYPQDDTTRVGCSLPLNIYGLDNISITSINSSTGVTTPGAFNSLLSCTGCSTPSFSPGLSTPLWIDYQICGTPQASACGVYQACDTVRLYTADLLDLNATPNPAEFCSGGSVLLTASATGGDGNYTFNWYDSGGNTLSTTNTYNASAAGAYTVEVLDGLVSPTCPAEYISVPVTVGLPPTVNAGMDVTVCADNPAVFLAGSVTNATGGIWSGGAGSYNPGANSLLTVYTPTAGEISAGSVTLTLTSTGAGGGCANSSDDITIFFSDTVFTNPSYAALVCNGDITTVNANATGGTGPYSYFWSTGSSASSVNVSAGTYSVTVTDIYGCDATAPVTVSQPSPIILTMSSTNTSTDIACDGTASVSISGGVPPYTVQWMDLQTTLTATGLCYGVATVTVTDANGCQSVGSVVVNNPTCSAFSVSASNTDVDCYGDANAQAFSFPSGGTLPYSYSWNTTPVQTAQNATGLSAGTYTVTVTDGFGCIDVASVTVLQPTVMTNTMIHTDVTSIGGNNGTATANPAGGTGGYTYNWNPTAQTTQTAVNLSAGVYYVNIQDGNSCLKLDSVQVNEPPCNDFIIAVNPTNISCNGLTDGSAYIVIAQGTPPYSISWSSGETDVTSVTGLAAGSYTVTVTDASNCTTFETFDITEPDALTIGLVPTNISCYGEGDGTIDLTVSGGTFPYTYSWIFNTKPYGSQEDLVNLLPGTYSVTVVDANGCTVSGSVGITQPTALGATYTYSDIVCNGDANGSVDATITGGTMPYSYSWTGPGGYTNTTQDISGLNEGLYELQVTDGNGCTLNNVLQSYINEPDPVTIELYTVNCPVPGSGISQVSIDSISGGNSTDYSVSFDGGSTYQPVGDYTADLAVGATYNTYAMDASGCVSPAVTAIVVDDEVTITSVTFNPCVTVGTTDINITVAATGGDGGPYEVSTDGGSTFSAPGVYTVLVPVGATYQVVVRDTKGCVSLPTPVVIPAPFDANGILTAEASCPGASDGAINLTITGGTLPYTISWTGPSGFTSSLEDISGLVAGTYDVTVTDDSSCVVNTSVVVTTTPDVTPPTILTCGSGTQNVVTDAASCTYTHAGTAWDATASDNCLVGSVSYALTGATTGGGTSLDGVVFNLGTTTVTWTATDGSGNTATCTFDVIVADNELPAISSCGASGTQNVSTDAGVCTYTHSGTGWDATATDNCTVSTVTYALTGATTGSGTSLDGVVFNPGTTTVTWTVTDGSGNMSTCTFDVVVTDTELPAITSCGASGTQNVVTDPASCTYTNSGTGWDATATDNCTVSTVTYALTGATTGTGTSLDGVIFNLGTTTVTWTATDNSGNMSTCTFDVIVTDTELPAISSCGASGTQNVSTDAGVCTYTQSGTGWDATATDNCTVSTIAYALTGVTTGSGTSLDGVVFNPGTTTVTWTVTDGSGNVSTCTFDVVVTDNELPAITSCGASGTQNVSTDAGVCTYTQSGTGWDATATDNCTVSTITYALTGATTGTGTSLNGVVFNLGTTTVTWTVTDNTGNVSTCTFDVIVTDNELPAFSSCGASGTQSVSTDAGVCTYTQSGTGWDATATDNCTVSTVTYALTGATTGTGTTLDGVVFNPGTTTVTWTVTDGSGNISTCTFDVIVTDTELPVISSCGASGTQSVVTDPASCTYTNSGTGWDATATDNCTVSTIIYTLSGATTGTGTTLDGVAFNIGTTTVTWTVTDNTGNVSTCTFDVVVTDTELPAISSCGASGTQNVSTDAGVCTYTQTGTGWDATATDNCTVSTITYALTGATIGTGTSLNGVVFNPGTTTVTWTVTDGSGNVSTCTFDVVVTDNELPAITSCGASGTQNVSADAGVCTYTQTGTGWDATATDNCTVSTIIYTLSGVTTGTGTSLNGVVFNLGTTTVTWTVTDNTGNVSTCTFDVIVTDDELPAITSCGASGTQNVSTDAGVCTYTQTGTGWDATATDNCTVSTITYALTGVTTGTGTSLNGVVFNPGTTTVTWTVTDGSGNVSTCTFDVVVTDTELPAITSCGASGTQNVFTDGGVCTYTHSGTGWNATATDNCTVSTITYALTGATIGTGTSLNGVVFNLGTTTVTWTVTDNTGNVSTCTFDVIVTDGELPSFTTCGPSGNQTVNAQLGTCTYTYSGTGWNAIATDNCTVSSVVYSLSGATTGTGTSLNGVTFNLGTTLVTWTVTDGSGNTSTCSFTVTVLDDQNPVITSCGASGTQNVSTDAGVCTYTQSGTGWDATATDNCTVASLQYVLTGATTGSGSTLDGVSFAQGLTTVTWTVTDGSGNTASCSFNVIVTDNELPVVSNCPTTVTVNNDAGSCGAIVTWTPPSYTDNCGASMTSTYNSGDYFPVGTTTVTYTVTDGSGNVSTCVFDVVVTDNELPQLTCPANISGCDSLVTFMAPSATDNCGVVSVTQTAGLPSGSIFPVGTTVVTYQALDVNGNVNSCSFNVVVYPTPILSAVTTDVTCNGNNDGMIDLTVTNGTMPYTFAWSNSATTEDLSNLQPGTYGVTVTDANNCSASMLNTITEPDALIMSYEVNHVDCNGGNDGSIDLFVSGGVQPYTFAWSNNATTEDISGLTAGTYTVTITDANNCQISDAITVNQPNALAIQAIVYDATCSASNGSITTLVTGGVSPYNYSWSNGETTQNLTNVPGGPYTLTVTDANGCVLVYTDTVGSSSNITGYVHTTDVLCNGGSSGTALAVIETGNAPYSYQWSTGDTTDKITGLSAGSYSLSVVDAFGCSMNLNFEINEPDSLYVELYSPEPLDGYNISFYGASDGSIQTTVYGGTPAYSYLWSTGSTSADIYGLPSGVYSVIVTDANGCATSGAIRLIEPYELAMPEGLSPNGDNQNDYFVIKGIEAFPDNELIIYNRWGNIVYERSGYENDWQGENNKGEMLPDGTYFAIFRPVKSSNVVEPLTGYVDLRRKR